MGRFGTAWLASDDNLAASTDLAGTWIDKGTTLTRIEVNIAIERQAVYSNARH